MREIDPTTLALIHRKVDEVISGTRTPGVDTEWIRSTTHRDRLYALELLRWHTYGKERRQAEIKNVIEVVHLPKA